MGLLLLAFMPIAFIAISAQVALTAIVLFVVGYLASWRNALLRAMVLPAVACTSAAFGLVLAIGWFSHISTCLNGVAPSQCNTGMWQGSGGMFGIPAYELLLD